MRLSTFFLYSLFFHASVALIWKLWEEPLSEKKNMESPSLAVTWEEKPTEASQTQPSLLHQKKSGSLVSQSFLPKYRFEPQGKSLGDSPAAGDSYAADPLRDNPLSEWGSGAANFGRVEDYNLFRVLFEQVDGYLYYPGVLARHKITGVVNARIVINDQGACVWPQTKIQGHDPYLSLYVLNVLKNVCQMNYKAYSKNRQISNADLSFQFDINENNDAGRIKGENHIIGNTLLFYRNSHQSVAEWEIGPFRGQFPVPAVYLNIPWIQEHWESLMHNKDPLHEFKKEFGEG